MLNVTFLGTAGSLPTPERNPSAVLINREGEMMLFDCGEGTQRQMMRARTGMMRLNYIFLTHLHADHILGIPGLLETLAFQGREDPITVVGPMHTVRLVESFKSVCYFSRKFDVQAIELQPGDVLKMKGCQVRAISTNHSVPSLGYSLEEDMRLGRFNRDAATVPRHTARTALRKAAAWPGNRGRWQKDRAPSGYGPRPSGQKNRLHRRHKALQISAAGQHGCRSAHPRLRFS